MVLVNQILKKEVGLFAENNIDDYREKANISLNQMLKIFMKNEGFFVLIDKNNKVKGYLDLSDSAELKNLVNENKQILNQPISKLMRQLSFKQNWIFEDESIHEVLNKFNMSNQMFFPVLNKDNELIGRVSKKIIKEKINRVYEGLNILD